METEMEDIYCRPCERQHTPSSSHINTLILSVVFSVSRTTKIHRRQAVQPTDWLSPDVLDQWSRQFASDFLPPASFPLFTLMNISLQSTVATNQGDNSVSVCQWVWVWVWVCIFMYNMWTIAGVFMLMVMMTADSVVAYSSGPFLRTLSP